MASHWTLAFLALLAHVALTAGSLARKNVATLTEAEVLTLQSVLRKLEDDESPNGFQQAVASFHGEPSQCTDPRTKKAVACCIHGMATFPQWHRLYVTQFEQALVNHGLSNIGVPYWDWTQPITELPPLVQNQIFRDPNGGMGLRNAWFSGDIHFGDLKTSTARAVDNRLFQKVAPGENTDLFNIVLDALEQDDYCQFEVQFEVAHNHIHYLVGGRHDYSMSTLEYSSYDPIFFLHHSNVDRIFAIWQKLQEKRGKPFEYADCSVELFRKPLEPFNRDSNPIALTKNFARADGLFSFLQLGYTYDDLSLNGLNIDELYSLLESRKARERAFAVFALYGIGTSADVKVQVCEGDEENHEKAHCEDAGHFFILGGKNEMPWEFHLPFYFDISDAVEHLVHALDGHYHVVADVYSVNGTSFGHGLLPHVHGSHRPSKGFVDPAPSYSMKSSTVVRKDVDVLTDEEVDALREAMARFQADTSVDGYQAVAEFHGLPPKCPHPDAAVRYACCIHGMPTFPHWHRLYVVEVEDELKSRSLEIGIPYWDWTRPNTKVPAIAANEKYVDPKTNVERDNPFYKAAIAFIGLTTARDVMTELTVEPAYGDHTPLYDAMLLAFEQEEFCDFELQFEVVHNAPHFLVGGFTNFSLSTLHYSAFDPIFYLHHSNVDRLWAIWQKLQIIRGKPYKAHCANSMTHELLKPFGFPPPWNNDKKTFDNARPLNIYDYSTVLDYTYDNLLFGGMTPDQLNHYLEERKTRDRVFVGIGLHQIGVSAWVTVQLKYKETVRNVGSIAVLGGELEMPWRFDRLFKVEITDDLRALGLDYKDDFEVHLVITDVYRNVLDENIFSHDTIIRVPGTVHEEPEKTETHVRSNLDQLTREQEQNLRDAFEALEADTSNAGYTQIAAFHGQPNWCPSPAAEKRFACCTHGMAVFPHWHRLITVQAENALRKHGLKDGLPYWDWTLPITKLPEIVEEEKYTSPKTNQLVHNPLYDAAVEDHRTTRQVNDKLFEQPAFGKFTKIAEQVLLAFEQTNFCDFEVQFEIAHNYIHALVGGNEPYSMASLRFTAFDPIFYFHHSMTDRIWAIWQKLQKYRGLPYNTANCAVAAMREPLKPFGLSSVINPDPVTREHSTPFDVFNYQDSFHYKYDDLQFNGLSISQIQREVLKRQHDDRAFAGFLLHGIKESTLVVFEICSSQAPCKEAGEFYLLGDEFEIPWSYDRLYKYEITQQLQELGIDHHDNFWLQYTVFDLTGKSLGSDIFGNATIVLSRGHATGSAYYQELAASSHVRRNLEDLSAGEIESLKSALLDMHKDGTFEEIAGFHGHPGKCTYQGKKVGCCVHGMATFPHWHRLYVEQVENELLKHGSAVSVPYWDWTQPIRKLPDLISKATFFNSRTAKQEINPFFRGKITDLNIYTSRDAQPDLFNTNYFLEQVLLALEQTSFCDFEIQYEITHNALHSFLGGRGEYSLSTLDFSAFDPAFILHHAFVDKLWAIWQSLQKNRGLPFEEADCALNLMRRPLQPFANKDINHFDTTIHYSRPVDVYDYSNHLGYHYDNLELNDWSLDQLEEVLKKQKSRDRLFAGFLLHSIGTSADVEIYVCVTKSDGSKNCNHPAGKFTLLGGPLEMPFTFDRLYKYDISDPVRKLGYRLDSYADFDLQVKVKSVNGSYIDSSLLPKPSIVFVPGEGKHQDLLGQTKRNLVRKDVNTLSVAERRSLVVAMKGLQEDHSADGFQSLAAFHALPPLCPEPSATQRFACCIHGMATFPMWHRLYTVQFEDALRRHGALVGIPYLDSLAPMDDLPGFLTDEKFHDSILNADIYNPWTGASIDFEKENVVRDVQVQKLRAKGKHGFDTWSFNQYIFALEQESYCDFEIQFEIAHNAIHAWLGGSETFSMGHLHYASYDPAFIVHHSFTDRIFALWQALQTYRGYNPNDVNCALDMMREPLKPFSFGAPYNLNPDTKEYSKPEDTLDYQSHFHYEYDILQFQGMDVVMIQDYINDKKEKDRVFAGFLLHGIGRSAHVQFDVCTETRDCYDAGFFDVLGGSAEMPWRFDRLYKYEITDVLASHDINVRDAFTIKVHLTDPFTGSELSSSAFPEPTIILDSKDADRKLVTVAPNRVRHDLSHLGDRDLMTLKSALADLKRDTSNGGFQALAKFHGAPALCPTPEAPTHACCIHGMPTFPHWHRLYTVEIEDALIRHGAGSALPYWDWTLPIDKLPDFFTSETFYDAWRDEVMFNPFARGFIEFESGFTVRSPQPELFKKSKDGKHSVLFDEVLLALEQTDFCDFEVQYEVVHNAIHYLVGGHQKFSLATLEYSAYDPIFYVHHTMVDKIWVVWQELQKRRGLPHDRADCAVNYMNEKLHPFDWEGYNPDGRTRSHAIPSTVFDYEDLGYQYDNFEIGGLSLDQLEALIKERQSHARVFAGFLLRGIGTSADVVFKICKTDGDCVRGGGLFILGGPLEMPWAFDRLVKYDITEVLASIGVSTEDVFDPRAPFSIKYDVHAVNGSAISASLLTKPTIIYEPAHGAEADHTKLAVAGIGVRKDINTLTDEEIKSLRDALQKVMDGASPISFEKLAEYHGYPGLCTLNNKKVACCHHGMASFPQWHRLFVKELELMMTHVGARVGIPYWDWTKSFTELPALVREEEDNPFHHYTIKSLNKTTSRAPRPQLFKDPEQGDTSFFYRQVLLALEQRDYCDFEVQYEVIHNAIHSWVGGPSEYGLSTLEYSAFDPLFFIHHSNVDRLFAIWQALQKYRGLDYNSANCDIQELRLPLKPFDTDSNPVIRDHATAVDSFNYEQFNYQYDNLNFHGLTIPELEELLEQKRNQDRIFANFMLKGFQASADVVFDLCDEQGHCNFAGTFAVLGGPLEMPWSFDRLFKYDVTDVFNQMRLRPDSQYHFNVKVTGIDGLEKDADLLEPPSVSFVTGKQAKAAQKDVRASASEDVVRYEVSELSLEQASNLRNALYKLQNDHGPNGFEAIASFHGAPGLCPEGAGSQAIACCQHGMPAFPHWHRLLTVQFERALRDKGAKVGVPYWDWTRPGKALPSLFTDPYDSNPFKTFRISSTGQYVTRDVQHDLFDHPSEGDLESLFHQAIEMLEEDNYCDFEVQYEMLHNAVHALVGGNGTYSMATLGYSAYDPFFMVHHASIDRLWRVWQQLQMLRLKPFNYAPCAGRALSEPLEPFNYESVNKDAVTKANALPVQIFDTEKFHYHYDNLKLNNHDITELNSIVDHLRDETRIFAAFLLHGFGDSATVEVFVVPPTGDKVHAGYFYVLGGPEEMPWAYERPYKLDITDAIKKAGQNIGDTLKVVTSVKKYDGTDLPDVTISVSTFIERPAHADYDVLVVQIGPEQKSYYKVTVKRGTKVRFHATDEQSANAVIRELGSFTAAEKCVIPPGQTNAYQLDHDYVLAPGDYYFAPNNRDLCLNNRKVMITIEDE